MPTPPGCAALLGLAEDGRSSLLAGSLWTYCAFLASQVPKYGLLGPDLEGSF